MTDLSKRKQFRVGVVGVTPGLLDAIEKDNLKLEDYKVSKIAPVVLNPGAR